MPLLRSLLTALLLLSWLAGSSECLLAGVIEGGVKASHCCPEGKSAPSLPEDGGCQKCVTLESGINLSALQTLSVDMPLLAVDDALIKALEALGRQADVTPIELMDTSPPGVRLIWHFVARTALPVRGPSLLA